MNVVAPVCGWAKATPRSKARTLRPAERENPESMLREYVLISVRVL